MKTIRTLPVFLILPIILNIYLPILSAQDIEESFIPLKTDTPPVIDGILDDEVWQAAPSETGFTTWYPDFGKKMDENTIVFYAYDEENLFFAFKCFDSEPDKIKYSVTWRDNTKSDDWICINLDTFNDQQSLYAFYINPLGIQSDSRATPGNEDMSIDVVWFSKGQVDEDGYSVEVKIPFKSIRYSDKDPVEMGVIFERMISRKPEMGTYPPLDPDQGANFLTQTRTLIYNDVKPYKLIELLPATTYGKNSSLKEGDLKSDRENSDISLTAKYGITSDLILDGTINPDFSQVEADAGQVDFNQRFALYHPEKRPFFLEGRENFAFGGHFLADPVRSIVYTRQIVNPIAGLKLTGKIGNKNTLASMYAVDELQNNNPEGDYANFSIMRYKRSLKKDSFIGGYYTGREINDGFNRVLGSDAYFRLNEKNSVGLLGLYSSNNEHNSTNTANGHFLSTDWIYDTRKLSINANAFDISENFNTKTGFLRRTDYRRIVAIATPRFFPKTEKISRVALTIMGAYLKDKATDLTEVYNAYLLRVLLASNFNFSLRYNFAEEIFLGEKFNRDAYFITAGSQVNKKFTFNLSYKFGKQVRYVENPYQGEGTLATAGMIFQPSEKFSSKLNLTYVDFINDRTGVKEFDYTILYTRNTYQLNKYLFFRGIFEYNSFRKELLTDFLVSFTYIPGTVFHIGFGSLYQNLGWEDHEYRPDNRFREFKRGFILKASYLWRM